MFAGVLDRIRGKAVTIPPMDGPLRPNTALDRARVVLPAEEPDNLAVAGGRLFFSAGASLLAFDLARGGPAATVDTFGSAITALATAPGGERLALGLDEGIIIVRDVGGGTNLEVATGIGATALAFLDADTLIVCQGAADLPPSEWARDLMRKGASGSVWRLGLGTGAKTQLARGLAFPFGVVASTEGQRVVVSEAWRHRLVSLSLTGGAPVEPVLTKLPGYPARLSPAAEGGAWLSLFAPRNRLIEFVLQEDEYRAEMLRAVPPEFWIAPALRPRRTFLEPLQCGAVRTMGVHKPWAPTRSYGLLVKLDRRFKPVASFHSRSDGRRHGVMSAVEHAGDVYVAAKGGDAILALPTDGPAP